MICVHMYVVVYKYYYQDIDRGSLDLWVHGDSFSTTHFYTVHTP